MKSDIQQRYLSIITEYVVDMSYIREEDNIVVDCLSRPMCAVTMDPCDLPAISESQKMDEELEKHQSQLKTYEIQGSSIWCDLYISTPRSYIPEPLRHLTSRTDTNKQVNKIKILLARHGQKYTNLGKRLSLMLTTQNFQAH